MPDDSSHRIDRRRLLKSAVAAGTLASVAHGAPQESSKRRAIAQENAKQGTRDWQLTRAWPNRNKYRSALIEGYCSQQSVAAGDKLQIFVSTDPARRFELDVYRMGFYDGDGACHKAHFGPLQGTVQPLPEIGPAPGRLRQCRWEPSVELTIADDWLSGVYLGKLTTVPDSKDEPYWQSYVIFIVRDDRSADFLFQCSDNTWQAYNRWPVNESLYTDPRGAHAPDVAVSFDRPYGMYTQIFEHPLSIGSGEFLLWEYPLCHWLEQHGYDVTYGSNLDSCDPKFIQRCGAFISVGHDEYWDQRQFRAVESAFQSGTDLIWLCGNSVFIDAPFQASSAGQANRVISRAGCYGELRRDELDSYASLFAGTKSTVPDERRIMGVRSVVPFNGGGDWTCANDQHWLFTGTGMKTGESIPGLVGWEHHGEPDADLPGMEVVAAGSVWSGGRRKGQYEAVVFEGPKDNFAFNASTIFWSQGLSSPPGHILPWSHYSRPHGPDPRVQQMTKNVLEATRRK